MRVCEQWRLGLPGAAAGGGDCSKTCSSPCSAGFVWPERARPRPPSPLGPAPPPAGSLFLGALAAAPAAVEVLTGLQAFRGFAGTSVLILVGVATDTARKFRAELAMQKYRDIDKLYDQL